MFPYHQFGYPQYPPQYNQLRPYYQPPFYPQQFHSRPNPMPQMTCLPPQLPYTSRALPSYPYGQYQPQQQIPQIPYAPYGYPQLANSIPFAMQSQIMNSPPRNFQSPSRAPQMASPQKNFLMQSQQQAPTKPIPTSPQPKDKQYLSFEEVQERIKGKQGQQGQQQRAPPTKGVSGPPPKQQQPQTQPQGTHPSAQRPSHNDDLEQRYQRAIQNTQKIVDQYKDPKEQQQKHSAQKQQQYTPSNNQDDHSQDEDQEELALQYEDGYIYRGKGVPPQTRDGFGILTDADGNEVYAGYWKDNFYHSQGRLYNLQKEELDGPLDWNNMTTIGNGWSSYEGNFVAGKMHGLGTLLLTNDEKYVGEFDEGMVNGDGEFTTIDGQVIKGVWEQGFLVQMQE